MKRELVHEFIEWLDLYEDFIKLVIKKELGVDTDFEIKVLSPSHTSEQYINLIEKGGATNIQLTATPLLSALFSEAHLVISTSYDTERCCGLFDVRVEYEHSYRKGSNGHEIMSFSVDIKTNEYERY